MQLLRKSIVMQKHNCARAKGEVIMKTKVLVAGATGYLGKYLVKKLKNQGYWVRVLVRKESQRELFEDIDDVFCGQVTN